VCLAGQAAEEIFFGDEYKSIGACNDIRRATSIASLYIRQYGFDGVQSKIVHPSSDHADYCNTDIGNTNVIIENMLNKAKAKAIELISSKKLLFKDIAQLLIDTGNVNQNQLVDMFKKHNEEISNAEIRKIVVGSYKERWDEYSW
jgi:ATP-dependent Zn protease